MFRRIMRGMVASLGILAYTGCRLLPEPLPNPARHDFGPGSVSQSAVPWSRVDVEAPEWLQDTSIHYRLLYSNPTEVRAYARDNWLAPPPVLLSNRLNSGDGQGACRLTLILRNFEQVFDQPGRSRVIMRFHASLAYDNSKIPLAERNFHFDMPSPSGDAPGALKAYPVLVKKAEDELKYWLSGQTCTLTEGGRSLAEEGTMGARYKPTPGP